MGKVKCNAIFLDLENEKQQVWFYRVFKLRLVKVSNFIFDAQNGGYVVAIKGIFARYIIWRNQKFIGKDVLTAAYKIPRE